MKNKTKKNKSMKNRLFTDVEYNSNDGFLTKIWGPSCWHFLHTMSFNYPIHPTKEQQLKYRESILSLGHILPCGKCRENLAKNFKKLPLTMKDMKNRDAFSRYIYNLHEVVNTMLCKKSNLTYEDVRERYEHFRSRCSTKKHRKTGRKPEKGCTEPIYSNKKSKCVLRIVPDNTKCQSLEIDKECLMKKKEAT